MCDRQAQDQLLQVMAGCLADLKGFLMSRRGLLHAVAQERVSWALRGFEGSSSTGLVPSQGTG